MRAITVPSSLMGGEWRAVKGFFEWISSLSLNITRAESKSLIFFCRFYFNEDVEHEKEERNGPHLSRERNVLHIFTARSDVIERGVAFAMTVVHSVDGIECYKKLHDDAIVFEKQIGPDY